MNLPCGALLLSVLLCSAPRQVTAPSVVFPLYRTDKSCFCINTKKQTATLSSTEIVVGESVFQVFHSRNGHAQEMFRIKIGSIGDKWWNFGIADEADFNGDGLPDYSWYGGDDTGFEMHLFLSSSNGYKQVDVLKTVESAWKRRFHKPSPDLGEAGGGYGLRHARLERSTAGLALLATVEEVSAEDNTTRSYRFRIVEAAFRK